MEGVERRERPIYKTILEVGALWTVASGTYGLLLPGVGFVSSYAEHPFVTACYYASWVLIAASWFGPVLKRLMHDESRGRPLILTTLLILFLTWFYAVLLPALPSPGTLTLLGGEVHFSPDHPYYLISKAFEILLQQVLVAVVVLTLAAELKSVRAVSVVFALCFWSIHLLLFMQGAPLERVILFSSAAFVSALFFPYLILRVPSGFILSYALHWSFYVVLELAARL